MSAIIIIGNRSYELERTSDVHEAHKLYDSCNGDQDEFERLLEEAGIKFYYDLS